MATAQTEETDAATQRAAFLDDVTDAMGRYLAGLLSTRCTAFVERGNYRSLLKFDATFDAAQPHCRACGAAVQAQVLCDACRRVQPKVRYGPTVVESMYRSSNMAYELDDDKKADITTLRAHMCTACDCVVLSRALAQLCWIVHSSYQPTWDTSLLNVQFDHGLVDGEGNYRTPISCGTAFHVPVGGLGRTIRDRVRELAFEWFKQVDQTMRVWFSIPVGRTENDSASVDSCARQLAHLVADRVALLDSPDTDQPDRCLSDKACDHLAAIQHLRCTYFASGVARNDMVALKALLQLAQEGGTEQQTIALLAEHRIEILRILEAPPPELLKALPSIVQGYRLDALRDVLGNQQQYSLPAMAREALAWRETINTSTLCVFLETAYRAANVWTMSGNLLRVVFAEDEVATASKAARLHPMARLPAMGWALGGRTWYLIPREKHETRRTGLDPPGLRIVLLCSVVHRLLSEESPRVFAPGCIAATVLSPLAHAALRKGMHAYGQLKEQLRPLTVGIEWGSTQTDLVGWSGSHVDNDVRDAARHLSRYTYAQLEGLFREGSLCHGSVGGGIQMDRLRRSVREMLLVKPRTGYTDFVVQALRFAMPILREYRQSLGFAETARSHPVGDVLRLHPAVRGWRPEHGELRLRASDLKGFPPALKLMIDDLTSERRLVHRRRPSGSTCFWYCFSSAELCVVLASEESEESEESVG